MAGVALKIDKFLGEAPKVSPELLPQTSAQLAYNTKTYSGDLIPYRLPEVESALARPGTIQTIYPMTSGGNFTWLHWTDDVDIAVGQVENDTTQRIYYSGDTTGEDTAKVTNYTKAITYDLRASTLRERTSNVATVTTSTPHQLATGEYVDTTLFGGTGYNLAAVPVTVLTPTSFSYPCTGGDEASTADTAGRVERVSETYPQSFFTLGLPMPTTPCVATAVSFTPIATATRSRDSGNTATLVLGAVHNLYTGAYVTVTGMTDVSFNQTNVQITVTGTTSFTYFCFGAAVTSGADVGGVVNLAGSTYPRTYVYTWLTAWGEESVPSGASNTIFAKEGQVVNITTLPAAWPGSYTGAYQTAGMEVRIYRTIASVNGTVYFKLGDVNLGTTTFTDDYDYTTLVTALPSEDYDQPPPGLRGMTAIHNGMMAGFFGNTVCFSKPNEPHAWPIVNYLQVDSNIIALGLVGRTVVLATDGRPWLVQGNSPDNMVAQKDDSILPCVSKRSLVNMPYGVVWASRGGLAVYSPSAGGAKLTDAVHSWDTWAEFVDPSLVTASLYQDKYFGSTIASSFMFERHQQTGGFLTESDTTFNASHYDVSTDSFYYAVASGGVWNVYRWDSPAQPFGTMDWKSKVFTTKDYVNLGVARVIADYTSALDAAEIVAYNDAVAIANQTLIDAGVDMGALGTLLFNEYPCDGSALRDLLDGTGVVAFVLYAGKKIVFTRPVSSDEMFRLPTGYRHDTYEVEVAGSVRVRAIHLAETADDLRRV